MWVKDMRLIDSYKTFFKYFCVFIQCKLVHAGFLKVTFIKYYGGIVDAWNFQDLLIILIEKQNVVGVFKRLRHLNIDIT
jgi:hypothetical protein